jgi:hypothetical protein
MMCVDLYTALVISVSYIYKDVHGEKFLFLNLGKKYAAFKNQYYI